MQGSGSLTFDQYRCFLGGTGTLTIKARTTVTMSGSGTLTAVASVASQGSANLPALQSVGGNTAYAFSSQSLPALISSATNEYVPPGPQYGYAHLPAFTSFGYTAGAASTGSVNIPALQSIGTNTEYAFSSQDLPALRSFGICDDALRLFSTSRMTSYGSLSRVQKLSLLSNITSTSYGSLTRIQLLNLLSSSTSTSHGSLVGSYVLNLLSAIDSVSLILLQIGLKPVLNETSRTWVLNLDTMATSQYDDYGFHEFVTVDGKSYGLAEDGIYELIGDDDAGQDIDALIDFGRSDFGSTQKKRVPAVYLGVGSGGKLLLQADADEQVYTYEARSYSDEIKNHRVDIGKGLVGNYWNFTLKNQNGDSFDLETIAFDPNPLTRKI